MANSQADRPGFVYVVSNPVWPGWVKIGCAEKPTNRLGGYQTGDPYRRYRLETAVYFPKQLEAERLVHRALRNIAEVTDDPHAGEWFKISVRKAVDVITSLIGKVNEDSNS